MEMAQPMARPGVEQEDASASFTPILKLAPVLAVMAVAGCMFQECSPSAHLWHLRVTLVKVPTACLHQQHSEPLSRNLHKPRSGQIHSGNNLVPKTIANPEVLRILMMFVYMLAKVYKFSEYMDICTLANSLKKFTTLI